MHDSKFKNYWNIVIIVMLIYTASFVPYRIAYTDDNPTSMIVIDTLMDLLFLFDLIMSFFTSYEDKKVGIEMRHRYIY